MTEERQSWRERAAAADAARSDAQWGMHVMPDDRPSPERLAWEAHQRGDQLFQIDMPVAWVQATTNRSITATTRTVRPQPDEGQVDVLGRIEAQGWHLEHVSTCFAITGQIDNGNLQHGHHGTLIGFYVFRRRQLGNQNVTGA